MLNCRFKKAISQSILLKKASLSACLFCFYLVGYSQSFTFNEQEVKAYNLVLNLQWENARTLLARNENVNAVYITDLSNALELLLNEDVALFDRYEKIFETNLTSLETKASSAEALYAKAELLLQWSFIYLKFGHEFDAALHLRKAYQTASLCKKRYPNFIPILKTHGLLQIMLGSVPEKYNWVLQIMGMQGSVQAGLKELEQVANTPSAIQLEAALILPVVHGYVLQQHEKALEELQTTSTLLPTNDLVNLIYVSLSLKNSQAENALSKLNNINNQSLPLVQYFLGEALLYKGDYEKSVQAFQYYANNFKGKSLIKDAHFKTGLCYQFLKQEERANRLYSIAKESGTTNTEADNYANKTLNSEAPINTLLFKIRFFTDGGYYEQAKKEIVTVGMNDLPTKKDQVEFYYRQARLADKTKQQQAARLFYEQVIDMSDQPDATGWYFAPNACLQLGYFYQTQNNEAKAKEYFTKALSYKKHEYKNSIDTKAKSALAQRKPRK